MAVSTGGAESMASCKFFRVCGLKARASTLCGASVAVLFTPPAGLMLPVLPGPIGPLVPPGAVGAAVCPKAKVEIDKPAMAPTRKTFPRR